MLDKTRLVTKMFKLFKTKMKVINENVNKPKESVIKSSNKVVSHND